MAFYVEIETVTYQRAKDSVKEGAECQYAAGVIRIDVIMQ